MQTKRLESFSDGVIAILITIMVLEFRVPSSTSWHALGHLTPLGLSYVLTFTNLGIYWSNHHHMIARTREVTGAIQWANLHLLFWLSLNPFATGWMGEHHFAHVPVAFYGIVQLGAGFGYYVLQTTIVRHEGAASVIARAIGRDLKGKLSVAAYAAAIGLAFLDRWISIAIYVGVAAMWLIPDRRLERAAVD
jgi:TMEM175 potassium channel family protein